MTDETLLRSPSLARELVENGVLQQADFAGAEPFVLDEVAAWLKAREKPGKRDDYDFFDALENPLAQRPPIRPPFARMWCEWIGGVAHRQMGALVETQSDATFRVRLFTGGEDNSILAYVEVDTFTVDLHPSGHLLNTYNSRVAYRRCCATVRERQSQKTLYLIGDCFPLVEKAEYLEGHDGPQAQRTRDLIASTWELYLNEQRIHLQHEDQIKEPMMVQDLATVFWGIGLCHAKNVTAPLVTVNRAARKQIEKANVSLEVPARRFRVLHISGSASRQSLSDTGGGKLTALHLVRGHFATYTETAPLFGRYAGMFWKSPHVRGDVRNGSVVKTYAPEPTPEMIGI